MAVAFLCLLASCQTDQKSGFINTKTVSKDTDAEKINAVINNIVDELSPPDSQYSGDFFIKYNNGLFKAKGYFRFGKRHGMWFYFYPDGKIWSEGFFENGIMNGNSKVYHENGKMYYEGRYSHDKSVGIWNFYDTTGNLTVVRTYDSTGKMLSDKPLSKGGGRP